MAALAYSALWNGSDRPSRWQQPEKQHSVRQHRKESETLTGLPNANDAAKMHRIDSSYRRVTHDGINRI